jgi:hypothetical protein
MPLADGWQNAGETLTKGWIGKMVLQISARDKTALMG